MHSKRVIYFIVFIIFHLGNTAKSQEKDSLLISFYNVENLFDVLDNPNTLDDEFTPKGNRRWNLKRYHSKLKRIYQVITHMGEGSLPDVLGVAEIENRSVLEDLLRYTPLRYSQYKIIHQDSPDKRGIDVALFYDTITIKKPIFSYHSNGTNTREILNFRFKWNCNTFSLYFHHWPSRYTGLLETSDKRINSSKNTLKIVARDSSLHTIHLGDFNDNPHSTSLQLLENGAGSIQYINLSKQWEPQLGTIKHKGDWFFFDQILVDSSLYNSSLYGIESGVFSDRFLLEPDKNYTGYKPFRCFLGMKYQHGFSDHLPIYIKIYKQ